MPIHVVLKPNSEKLHLINNHSAGCWALNAMIDKEKVGMQPDNIQDLGQNLLDIHCHHSAIPVWLFKSDVKNAYHLLFLQPLWQLKQVVTTTSPTGKKVCQIDQNLCFSSHGSLDIWMTLMGLIMWIAIWPISIDAALVYMDDMFGPDAASSLYLYAPYCRLLGILHSNRKHLCGQALPIIGFHVDMVTITITLPDTCHIEPVHAIRTFTASDEHRCSLWHHCGVYLLEAYARKLSNTHLAIYCNSFLTSLSIWCPQLCRIFVTAHMPETPLGMGANIFWFEAITVLAALCWVSTLPCGSATLWLAIFMDNLNTVQIFDSLCAKGHFVDILLDICSLIISAWLCINLRVWHVLGVINTVTNVLSCGLHSVIEQYCPDTPIALFITPMTRHFARALWSLDKLIRECVIALGLPSTR
ncbi:uncharacterized protein PHACADRAFT_160748 [Phanerochaete carnosa HHB-10118-sp]|uniref:Reverse transcriptase domain-containing protein n=1 Tax=Phanerochaete carnosa (strain HHB-10118-sp) TaxID=650164 RepID=K5W089_PHACS|nr:uncharacterized protein PHACADRAFT_160748 [Phanerochaete carnosa HHB-10118-sp]EKM57248.1 hypothetical protein PHACADRAFT_160748 [Phanerochaete carnosa HHB-10118-sp]